MKARTALAWILTPTLLILSFIFFQVDTADFGPSGMMTGEESTTGEGYGDPTDYDCDDSDPPYDCPDNQDCCQGFCVDPATTICCEDWFGGSGTYACDVTEQCCGASCINPSTHECCYNEDDGSEFSCLVGGCCGDHCIDPATQKCCDDKPDGSTYDCPKDDECCIGHCKEDDELCCMQYDGEFAILCDADYFDCCGANCMDKQVDDSDNNDYYAEVCCENYDFTEAWQYYQICARVEVEDSENPPEFFGDGDHCCGDECLDPNEKYCCGDGPDGDTQYPCEHHEVCNGGECHPCEICGDGQDNNDDGVSDCADPQCFGADDCDCFGGSGGGDFWEYVEENCPWLVDCSTDPCTVTDSDGNPVDVNFVPNDDPSLVTPSAPSGGCASTGSGGINIREELCASDGCADPCSTINHERGHANVPDPADQCDRVDEELAVAYQDYIDCIVRKENAEANADPLCPGGTIVCDVPWGNMRHYCAEFEAYCYPPAPSETIQDICNEVGYVLPTDPGIPLEDPCIPSDDNCDYGHCNPSTGVCETLPLLSPCTQDEDCASGDCQENASGPGWICF